MTCPARPAAERGAGRKWRGERRSLRNRRAVAILEGYVERRPAIVWAAGRERECCLVECVARLIPHSTYEDFRVCLRQRVAPAAPFKNQHRGSVDLRIRPLGLCPITHTGRGGMPPQIG